MKAARAALFVLTVTSCGGGPTPSRLSTPRVEVSDSQVQKRVLFRDGRLNLVKHIIDAHDNRLVIIGNDLICTVRYSGAADRCVQLPIDFWSLDVLVDASGNPTAVVGNGGWGRPSAATSNFDGTLRWRFDGGFQIMDTPVVVGSTDHGVVLVGDRAFDLNTGTRVNVNVCKCGAVASADFDQDGRREILQISNGELRIANMDGGVIARRLVGTNYVGEPLLVQHPVPFVVLSRNGELAIYNHELSPIRQFLTPEGMPQLQAVAAATLDGSLDGVIAVLVKGRGGWHRTVLYVFSASDRLIYMEVLGDDYESIASGGERDGAFGFMIGGRGEVWSYQLARKTDTRGAAR